MNSGDNNEHTNRVDQLKDVMGKVLDTTIEATKTVNPS